MKIIIEKEGYAIYSSQDFAGGRAYSLYDPDMNLVEMGDYLHIKDIFDNITGEDEEIIEPFPSLSEKQQASYNRSASAKEINEVNRLRYLLGYSHIDEGTLARLTHGKIGFKIRKLRDECERRGIAY